MLKTTTKLRPHQEASLACVFANETDARSGIIVLPCGAGKSLVGVAAAARMNKSCLVLCTSTVSAEQWKNEFNTWAHNPRSSSSSSSSSSGSIQCFTSSQKTRNFISYADVDVCITTYSMLTFAGKRSVQNERMFEMIRGREWGLLLLDEVHVAPADTFRTVVRITRSSCKLGLTATPLREDGRIRDLDDLIGPTLYEADWMELSKLGYIASVDCVNVMCPMTPEFLREYRNDENASRRQLLSDMNPTKLAVCSYLIGKHKAAGDKVIVFFDNTLAIKEYATRLGMPFIHGKTLHNERTKVLFCFQYTPIPALLLSKVGDTSINIPDANVLIQISSHTGSQRQEAQRLGRILRAKQSKAKTGVFYSLLSCDTHEVDCSPHRQEFLVEKGYTFQTDTELPERAAAAALSASEQTDLLVLVLCSKDDEDDDAELADAAGAGLDE